MKNESYFFFIGIYIKMSIVIFLIGTMSKAKFGAKNKSNTYFIHPIDLTAINNTNHYAQITDCLKDSISNGQIYQ